MDRRIQPSDLREHRRTHRLLGPNCLCPVLEAAEPDFVESTIYVPTSGPWLGLYVATCARERCAYVGKCLVTSHNGAISDSQSPIVVLEHLYHMLGLPIKSYMKRGAESCPQ